MPRRLEAPPPGRPYLYPSAPEGVPVPLIDDSPKTQLLEDLREYAKAVYDLGYLEGQLRQLYPAIKAVDQLLARDSRVKPLRERVDQLWRRLGHLLDDITEL